MGLEELERPSYMDMHSNREERKGNLSNPDSQAEFEAPHQVLAGRYGGGYREEAEKDCKAAGAFLSKKLVLSLCNLKRAWTISTMNYLFI